MDEQNQNKPSDSKGAEEDESIDSTRFKYLTLL